MLFQNSKHPIEMKVTHLNKAYDQRKAQLLLQLGDKKSVKALLKNTLTQKATHEKTKFGLFKTKALPKHTFVLDFYGDIKATEVQQLREEISTLLTVAKAGDEVIVRLESSGGMVHAYGLAAAQLARLKEAGLYLTVCIDKVAASGGYMMACVADKILAAPFAVVGSIGVVAQVPNFHELLEKHDIDVEVFTAGKYKRTVTVLGKNSEADKQKFQQELEETHQLFKDFVTKYRPSLDIEQVATGEHWYGEDAMKRHLVDELQTSDSYILAKMQDNEVYALASRQKPTIAQKLGLAQAAQAVVATAIDKLPDALLKLENSKWPLFKQ